MIVTGRDLFKGAEGATIECASYYRKLSGKSTGTGRTSGEILIEENTKGVTSLRRSILSGNQDRGDGV